MAATVAATMAGCGVSEQQYAAEREVLVGSPAARNAFVTRCVDNMNRKSAAQRDQMARIMNSPINSMPQRYCQRLTGGIVSGRITHAEVNAALMGQVSPNIIRVIQGR